VKITGIYKTGKFFNGKTGRTGVFAQTPLREGGLSTASASDSSTDLANRSKRTLSSPLNIYYS
jgi:hypothetical protein